MQRGHDELTDRETQVNDARLHYLRCGAGDPVLLLHGWPEFSLTWEPVMRRLADRFDLVAPDLRGFGRSEKPAGPSNRADAEAHATDMLGLMDALSLARVSIVSHDVGAYVAQALARAHPERVSKLFFFNCAYPQIGRRWAEPQHLKEIWYQSFNQMPFAAALVGSSREACRTYIEHFLRHWAANKHAFDDVIETWVDNFLAPGNLQGGFNWYLSSNAQRLRTIAEQLPPQPRIETPTCIRWGARDPLFPLAWTDRLGETFANLDFAPFPDVGHFPHREAPDRAAAEIARFLLG
jgi:pimeloyl-ACP methyl ester carboxylesterase